jgi:predicted lipase
MTFDLQLARQLAFESAKAYGCTPPDPQCIKAETGALAVISDLGDCTVIAFKGTSTIRDWLTDLDVAKKAVSNGVRVHSGFLSDADSILPKIIAALLPPGADKSKLKPLLITGHSLGGALATLVAFDLQQACLPVQAVYTFASPRVGNAGFRAAYNGLLGNKTFRVACAGDLVPLIPGIFTSFRDGYRHVGVEVFLNGIVHVAPAHYLELALDGWRAYRAIKAGNIDFILEFHSITGDYIAQLNATDLVGETS